MGKRQSVKSGNWSHCRANIFAKCKKAEERRLLKVSCRRVILLAVLVFPLKSWLQWAVTPKGQHK